MDVAGRVLPSCTGKLNAGCPCVSSVSGRYSAATLYFVLAVSTADVRKGRHAVKYCEHTVDDTLHESKEYCPRASKKQVLCRSGDDVSRASVRADATQWPWCSVYFYVFVVIIYFYISFNLIIEQIVLQIHKNTFNNIDGIWKSTIHLFKLRIWKTFCYNKLTNIIILQIFGCNGKTWYTKKTGTWC